MNKQEFSNFIKNRYEEELNWYDQKSIHDKKYYNIFQILICVSSAVTPIFILMNEPNLEMLAVGTSAVIAISTSLVNLFKYRENWINYRTAAEIMRREYSLYNTGIGDYFDVDNKQKVFVERIENLILGENTRWRTLQKKKK